MLSVTFYHYYVECHYAECRYAERRYANCRGTRNCQVYEIYNQIYCIGV
jgi:hypothetical protein